MKRFISFEYTVTQVKLQLVQSPWLIFIISQILAPQISLYRVQLLVLRGITILYFLNNLSVELEQ